MKKLNDFESIKAALDEFLAKENTTLDKYDLLMKKAWLTTDKPEPQAAEFARILKNLADSLTGSNWKVLYKTK